MDEAARKTAGRCGALLLLLVSGACSRDLRPASHLAARPVSPCRALINVATDDGYWVADVRMAGPPRVAAAGPGLVVKVGASLLSLDLRNESGEKDREEGGDVCDQVFLVATELRGGDKAASIEVEVEGDDLVSIIGPYVAVKWSPPRAFDVYSTYALPHGEKVALLEVLGSETRREVLTARRKTEDSESEDDTYLALFWSRKPLHEEDGPLSGLHLGAIGDHASMRLTRFPQALERHGRLVDKRFIEAPNRCAAVGVARRLDLLSYQLEIRPRAARAVAIPWKGPKIDYLLGVTWIAVDAAVDISRLPKPERVVRVCADDRMRAADDDDSGGDTIRDALRRARNLAGKKRYADAIKVLTEETTKGTASAALLGELGWLEFLARRYDAAKVTSEKALAAARTDRQRAAILYNLGRIAEAKKDTATARARYTESLRKRSNKSVSRRLQALPR